MCIGEFTFDREKSKLQRPKTNHSQKTTILVESLIRVSSVNDYLSVFLLQLRLLKQSTVEL